MTFNHRKMLAPYVKDFFIPCFQNLPPPPPPQPPRELSLLVPISICIIGSVLLLLFLFVFLFIYITQPRRSSAATVAPGDTNRWENEDDTDSSNFHHVWRITTVGLNRSAIDSITVVGFKKGEGIIEGTECSVCLSEFEEDVSLRLLPKCNHGFHINCIDTWLLSHKNCPLCRAPVLLTKPPHQETETNHLSASRSSNDLSGGQESSRSRNPNLLPRAQSDLANHCGSENIDTVRTGRRSFSIGGSSSVKTSNSDDIATGSRRQFYTSFSANFFSSSRRSRNQDLVLPTRMPSVSGYTA